MKLRGKLLRLLIGLAALPVFVLAGAEVSTRISSRRAERLLHDLNQLQVGKSTFEDARAMIARHGGGVSPNDHLGCSPAHCTFWVALDHYPLLMKVWGPHISMDALYRVFQVLPRLGMEDWQAGASVTVDEGIVTRLSCSVLARCSGGGLLGRLIEEFSVTPEYLKDRMRERSYYVHWLNITTVGGGEGIHSVLTPRANADERARAYDYDLSCLTRVGGCTSLCQFAPLAFADLVKESHWVPYLDEKDPNCAKFKSLEENPSPAPNR
jgi:hypothetical protein